MSCFQNKQKQLQPKQKKQLSSQHETEPTTSQTIVDTIFAQQRNMCMMQKKILYPTTTATSTETETETGTTVSATSCQPPPKKATTPSNTSTRITHSLLS